MKKKSDLKGFTVLEFLVVIGIMMILIALILIGLTRARSNAGDQARVADVQTIVIGLKQFHDVCRVYPATLDESETCADLGGSTLGSFIADLARITNDPKYSYSGLAGDPLDLSLCTGFHIGVELDGTGVSTLNSKSGDGGGNQECGGSDPDQINGMLPNVFDIKR